MFDEIAVEPQIMPEITGNDGITRNGKSWIYDDFTIMEVEMTWEGFDGKLLMKIAGDIRDSLFSLFDTLAVGAEDGDGNEISMCELPVLRLLQAMDWFIGFGEKLAGPYAEEFNANITSGKLKPMLLNG
jgi:hypothetical protein